MVMTATVLRVDARSLLVRDMATGNQVLVNTPQARSFRIGDVVRITYSGRMTFSIPPQITATRITRVNPRPPQPQPPISQPPSQTEIRRATVLQVRQGALLVRNPENGQQVIVNYAYAHHFCPGQLINVRYDSIVLSNPNQLNATDITPVC